MKLSVVYVNYNTEDLLIDSLGSLKKNLRLDAGDYEVLVVDNASSQLNEKKIKNIFKGAKIVYSKKNLGFGGGNNLGVSHAIGDYVWLLNTDTIVPSDNNMHKLINFIESKKDYAAALPLLTDNKGIVQPGQIDNFPTPYRLFIIKPICALLKLFFKGAKDIPHDRDVDVAVAASLIVSREAYLDVGGFDDRYFMYYEDTDFCREINKAGYKIRFFTAAHIIHLWGSSISSSASRKKMYYESQDKYFRKWYGEIFLILLRVFRSPLYVKNVVLEGIHE